MFDKAVPDFSLYLVTDRDILGGRDLAGSIEEAIAGGVTVVQLREKTLSSLEFYHLAREVKAVTDRYRVPLIINDRLDIALAVDAAGLHVGQNDLPAAVARRLLGPEKILGVSAASLEEALLAERDGADYLGVGAIFPTATKSDVRSVALEDLQKIKGQVKIPVVAIGGINQNNIKTVMETGIDGVAVVSAILGKDDITRAAKNL
ncbi:MAG: Thiamin-phosphate pyrophosphorylase [Firmicutes bacterium]|nr:Thiamin-phosphate pyrophosphorylase [Bacillota bacterium]MDI6704801.1 thiamine phosphate synthase [Bacillota bacterium]